MEILYVALSAFGGGVGAGLLGWLEKGTGFSGRKFLPTIIRAIIAGGVIAISYPFVEQMGLWAGLIGAFLAGAGIDVLGHRIAGTMKSS